MAPSQKNFDEFWNELKRRRVVRGIFVYGATALLLLESIDILLGTFGIEDMPLIVIWILGIGFVVSVVFSWYYDVTQRGIQKTKTKSQISTLKTDKLPQLRTWKATTFISLVIIIALLALNLSKRIKSKSSKVQDITIAVLPFNNMSDNDKYAYFGDAMTESITLQLAKIKEFKVRARTSVMQYKSTDKTSQEIGHELNVKYFIEGSTQRFENIMHIIVQLIETESDEHIWQSEYTREWKEITTLQSEIATDIARECKIVLTADERENLSKKLTENPYAMDFYIRGNDYINKRNYARTDLNSAIQMYQNAIELDPKFAMAYAKLARAYIMIHWVFQDPDKEMLEKGKNAIENAFEIEPGLTEAHIALGLYYYHGNRNYNLAIEQFDIALSQQPKNIDGLLLSFSVYRRQGKWKECQQICEKILEIDPLDALILNNIAVSYEFLQDYEKALEFYDRAIILKPDWNALYQNKIGFLITWKGETTEARKVLEKAMQSTNFNFTETRCLLDIYDGNYANALKILIDSGSDEFAEKGDFFLLLSRIHGLLNNSILEKNNYDSARVYFERQLINEPGNPQFYTSLGISLAGLSKKKEAIDSGEKAVELLPVGQDAILGSDLLIELVKIYTMTGEYNSAFGLIEQLLSTESNLTINLLKLDPIYSPLLDLPEFKKILEIASTK